MIKKLCRRLFPSPAMAPEALLRLLQNPMGSALFLRIDRLGDLLVSSPLIRAFKKAHPGWTVTLLAGEANFEAASRMEWVDRVLLHEKKGPLATLLRVRGHSYDLAVDLNAAQSFTSGFLARFSGAPVRLGYVGVTGRPDEARQPSDSFLNVAVPLPERPDEIPQLDLQEEMASFLGLQIADWAFDFRPRPAAAAFGADFFLRNFSPRDRVVALHPGNIKKNRMRWPIEKFSELADRLGMLEGVRILLIYGPNELPLLLRLRDSVTPATAAKLVIPPLCSLAQTAALVARARLFIDSGPTGTTHLVTTLPTPQVTIYCQYSFKTWDTRKKGDLALVSNHWEDTSDVEVDAVYKAVLSLLV